MTSHPEMITSRLSRRSVVTTGALAFTGLLACAGPPDGGAAALASLERARGGRLGVFALDLQTSRTLTYRADERFKLYSTFKALLAALVLRDVAAGREALEAFVTYDRDDLLAASPVTEANVARGGLSVRELCEAMMARSDNAAANLLMARTGGPAGLTRFLRTIGDRTTRVDSLEGQLEGRPADFDTTTPRAIVGSVRALLSGSVLAEAGRGQLEGWLRGNLVGNARLRATLPPAWRTGDRTGTGDGFCNDVAFARRPDKAPMIVAAYHEAEGMEIARQEAVLRAVGRIVVDWQA